MKPPLSLLLLILTISLNLSRVICLSPDGLSLLALKSAIDPSSDLSVFSNWNEEDKSPCLWSGISCMNVTGFLYSRVVGIALSGKNLTGYIPSELGTLIYLRRLNLHGNKFHGTIPELLFKAMSLHSIFLYGNNLTGVFPMSICELSRLQNLDLSLNGFEGKIGLELGKCNGLQRLILAGNKFSGEIVEGVLGKLENLVQLDLSDNKFSGNIPEDIGDLKLLSTTTLNLSFNHFSGSIPKSLGKLPVTVNLDLRNNNLSGEIPQTGSFTNQGPTSFLNNPLLCGFPLQKPCKNSGESSAGGNRSSNKDTSVKKEGLKKSVIILISVADAAGVALIGLIIIYIYWKKKDSNSCSCTGRIKLGGEKNAKTCSFCYCPCINGIPSNESEDIDNDSYNVEGDRRGGGEGGLVAIDKGFSFELDELLRSSAYVLGKSGLGIVYKVVLGNGIPVAVRRLGEGGEQRYKEFTTEVQAIGRVKHPNIVRLRAYYWANDEKLLICDFISHGNLANALHGRNGQPTTNLSWLNRLRIAKGAAHGLAYLHECSQRKFVHGDIKPSNILIDSVCHPYISDFGLNRLISITGSNPDSSSGFVGGAFPYAKSVQHERTNNYRAPEARLLDSRPNQKWDVYSFGVILLELLTGKSPDYSSPTTSSEIEVSDLVRWVRKGFEDEQPLSDMVDQLLLQEIQSKKEVLSMFHVALACTDVDPETRPRMKTVSENLDNIG